ncbi:MAG: phage portal protein [Bacteriovoracaceae bacterium]
MARLLVSPGGGAVYAEKDYENFSKETYLKNIIGFRCILEIAQACSFVEWYLNKRISEDQSEYVNNHELNDLMNRPNADQSWNMLIYRAAAFLVLSGNSFFERVRLETRKGRYPKEMYVLRPDRIKMIPSKDGRIASYEYSTSYGKQQFEIDPISGDCDLLHLKLFHPTNDFWGASAVEPASREIDSSNEATDWNMSLIRNQGRPGMVFTLVGDISDEQFDLIERQIEEKFSGSQNAGRNMVLTGDSGTKAEPYSFTPQEMEFIEGNREMSRRIALAFGVPPQLLGIPGDTTYCLPADTMIATPKGPKEIATLAKGDFVYSMFDGNMTLKPVLWQGKVGRKKLYKVKTKNREVIATANHPFLVRETEEIKAIDCSGKLNHMLEYKLTYKRLDELKIGDLLVQASKFETDSSLNLQDISIDEMELFGLYVGDGYCALPKTKKETNGKYKRGGSLRLSIHKNASYKDHYVEIARKYTGVKGFSAERYEAFGSSSYVRRIIDLGFGGRAHEKRVPEWVFSMPRTHKLAFLRGMLDADGTVDKNGRAGYYLCNKKLIQDLWHLCLSCGFQIGRIKTSDRIATLPNGKNKRQILYGFMISCASDVAEIGSYDLRYIERIEENKHKTKRKCIYKGSSDSYSREEKLNNLLDLDSFHFGKVTEIQELDVQDVFDIEVEDSHNFIAEGIIVHNSNMEQARLAFYETTVSFYLNIICTELNNWLFKPEDKMFLKYDMEGVPALEPRWESRWKRAQQAEFLTINEKRELTGYDRINGGDVILVPMGMQTLEMVSQSMENIDIEDEAVKVVLSKEEYNLLMGLREGWGDEEGKIQ